MIGRTDYHNVAGTRCATDFVELPSILMEHFVSSPAVISLFAKHWKTGEPVPMDSLQNLRGYLKGFASLENNTQITMALLDQHYHSAQALQADFDSTDIWQRVNDQYSAIPSAPGTSWQTNFSHLFGYGAT